MEVDGPYMTVFTGSMSPWCCRRKECIKAITPVFWSFIQPKLARYRSCFVQVDPNLCPTHFSAASVNASVNGDRESAVLIAHQFIVAIKSMNPVWASWCEVALGLSSSQIKEPFSASASRSASYITAYTNSPVTKEFSWPFQFPSYSVFDLSTLTVSCDAIEELWYSV